MAKICFSKAKIGQKSKKSEGKKVAPPGFEPGSLDPKSDALPTELLAQRRNLAKKFMYLNLIYSPKIL